MFKCQMLQRKHEKSHEYDGAFHCIYCSYTGKSKGNLISHQRAHELTFSCKTCGRRYLHESNLIIHQNRNQHGTNKTEPLSAFQCYECDESFSNLDGLKKHQNEMHKTVEFKCKTCPKVFPNRSRLRNHFMVSHIRVPCQICKKEISVYRLDSHIKDSHSNVTYECDLCDKNYYRKSTLGRHMRIKHLNGNHPCDSCSMKFTVLAALRKHKLIHTERKYYECDTCGQKFLHKTSLAQDIKSIRIFKCIKCKSNFKCLLLFKKHTLEEEGNRFACDQCSFEGISMNTIKRHLRKHKS